jgi:mRNA interferase RelE/StbE
MKCHPSLRKGNRGQPAVRTVARTIAVSLLRSRGLLRPQYRLRVGEIRVFYDVSGATVEILAIVAKSEAESWLAQFADPE